MADELNVFDDVCDEDGVYEFFELIGEFYQKDPYELSMKDWISMLITSSSKKNTKARLVELISNEYDIDMTMDDFVAIKTLAHLWKFICESMIEDKFVTSEEIDE